MRIEPVGRKTVRPVLWEFAGLIQDDGVACTSPLVCFSNDRAARDQECDVVKARFKARVGAGFLCLVEEELCAFITVRAVVEWSAGACLEPFSEPKDGHEVVVIRLGRDEVRNANADVVDKSGLRQVSLPEASGIRSSSFVNGGDRKRPA